MRSPALLDSAGFACWLAALHVVIAVPMLLIWDRLRGTR